MIQIPHLNDRAKLSRRSAVGAAGGAVLTFAGCGGSKNSPNATATVPPTEEPSPTPTQEPITSPVAGYADTARWTGRTLTIAAGGGDYQDAQNAAYFEPFAMATGATIKIATFDPNLLKDQVDNGSVSWDVTTFPSENVIALGRTNYLEPIDYDVVDKTPLFPEAVLQYGVGTDFFSTVIVYPPDINPIPQGWVDFWDVTPPKDGEKPDPKQLRALRHTPIGTLEFALLADGVETDKIYPIDADRAFASLDKIKQNVAVWYQDGKQPVELVVAGEVGMASAWNVRPWQLNKADLVRFEWYGGMLSADSWVVPKGAPNADVAMDFINFATRAVPSANFARMVPFGPANRDALDLLRPDRAAVLPTALANRSVQFFQNWNFWADNLDDLTARFEDWLLAAPAPTGTPALSPAS
jgi:putative spermidine/putrescine transport system substrate-binding protein